MANSTIADSRRALALGIGIALFGLICLGIGIALLAWRVVFPDEAVILPPHMVSTLESTPTPGLFSAPLALPPLPDNAAGVAILPVSELPTSTPTQITLPVDLTLSVTSTRVPSLHPSGSPTPIFSPSPTTSPTDPLPSPIFTVSVTHNPLIPTHTVEITTPASLTSTPLPTLTRTVSPTPNVTASPAPTQVPVIPDRIIIDKIDLDAPIVPVGQHPIQLGSQVYSQWDVPNQLAAGWHQISAPLGERGNTVLNGHHNVYGEVFRHLVRLSPGDIITLASGDQRYTYAVAQTMTLAENGQPASVRQTNARWILPTADERVTLITCWPYTANSHRLIVIAISVATLDHLSGIP